MTAAKNDFTIEAGTTFRRRYTWRQPTVDGQPVDVATTPVDTLDPVDLTGATVRMQAWDRDHHTKLIDFNDQGTVTVGGTDGTVTIYLSDEVTAALTFDVAKYDLKITSPNTDKTRLIEGRIRLTPQETV